MLTLCAPAAAQTQSKVVEFDIAPQALDTALQLFSRQSGMQLIFSPYIVAGRSSPGLRGAYDSPTALSRLLEGSGVQFVFTDPFTAVIKLPPKLRTAETPTWSGESQDAGPQTEAGPGAWSSGDTAEWDSVSGVGGQQAEAGRDTEAEETEVIVVTGSRIRRTNAQSPVPLQVFRTRDLDEAGTTDLAEAMYQLPGVSPGVSPQGSNNQIQTSGLSTISLRRLGDDRTLVLIEGKRAVSNSGNSDRVSLSALPIGFIKRTEVTTGGASAIYGSDAIAGVTNFILEDDFEGLQLDGRWSSPEASGGEEFQLNLKAGRRIANDRAYVLFGINYRDENMVRADETRPLSVLAVEFDDPATGPDDTFANEINAPGCDPQNEDRHCILPSRSTSTPGGVFENGDAWFKEGRWFNDQSLQPPDRSGSQDFLADFDGFNFRPERTLLAARRMFSIAGHSTFEVTPTIKASLTAMFSDIDTATAGGFETLNDDDALGPLSAVKIGRIAADHPFIPPEVEETRSGRVSFDRRLVELGEQQRINDRDLIRVIAGFSGQAWDDYGWEVYGTYGRFEQTQHNPNEVNFLRAQLALDIEPDGAGGFQCADAAARADGCVPLNIFGEGTITPAAADYIRYNGFATQVRRQYTAGGYITGPILELPSGPVQAAAGFEYRHEGQNSVGDPDGDPVGGVDGDPTTPDFNVTSLSTFPNIRASYDVVEGFAEIDVPVVNDRLNVQAAVRLAEYSTVGSIVSYNAGFVFRPIDDIRFRGQFSRAQRAPNLTELFSPPRPDLDDLADPCEGLMPDGTGIDHPEGDGGVNADLALVAANCLTEPGIQAFFAGPDNAGEPFDPDGRAQGPNSGNPNVRAETANTFTAGVVLQPRFIPGLTLIADYYRIEIKDAITTVSTQNTVDLCYSAADFPNNKFCDVITRSAVDGEVLEVVNSQENLEEELVSGIDATLLYDFEVPNIPGGFGIDFRYSHYLKQDTTFIGIGGVEITTSPLGEINDGNDEFRAKFGYSYDGLRFTYTVTYLDGGIDDLASDPDPDDNRFFSVGGQAFHRLYLSYDFGADRRYRIYAGINNLFDNFGPLLPAGLDNGNSRNIVGELNDALGREFFFGARARF